MNRRSWFARATSPFVAAVRVAPREHSTARHLIIACHGASANASQLFAAVDAWSVLLPEAAFLIPNAPMLRTPRGVINAVFGRRSWFSLSNDTEQGLAAAALPATRTLNHLVDRELRRMGLPPEKLVLVGFSQGGMMALGAGLSRPTPPQAIVALGSRLLKLPINETASRATCIMMAHGEDDTVVSAYYAQSAARDLSKMGFDTTSFVETGTGHALSPSLVAAAGNHMQTVVSRPLGN